MRTGCVTHALNAVATGVHFETGFFFNSGAGFASNLYKNVAVAPPDFASLSQDRRVLAESLSRRVQAYR